MKILITGAAGYIASHCCKYFANLGYDLLGYDNLERGHESLVKWCPLVVADIMDSLTLERTLIDFKPDIVFHLAGYIDIEESTRNPDLYIERNTLVTEMLLQAMEKTHVKKIVFSSTCAVYDPQSSLSVLHEDAPINPLSAYSVSKFRAEEAIKHAATSWGLQYVILRYFNACGADHEAQTGEWHEPENHIIPLIINTYLGKQSEFHIYGSDYDTADGTAIRDYIHVTDIAAAHKKALDWMIHSNMSDIFNIGSGCGVSVKNLISQFETEFSCKLNILYKGKRAGDASRLVASVSKAQQLMGWEAQYSSIPNILQTALRWQRMIA